MRRRFAVLVVLATLMTVFVVMPARAQDALIEMRVDAGYDSYFRDDQWFPVRVSVENNGDPIDARAIVRPQTTRGVGGTFSLPVDLPTNSRKTDFLHVTARGTVTQLRVELISNTNDAVLASRTVPVSSMQSTDQLYVVVTQSAAGSIDMTGAAAQGLQAYQANWEVETIPDNAAALESVNMIVFTDVDTGGLTLTQEAALEAWVADGGHLVVTGGPAWEATAAGLETLLPLVPNNDLTLDTLEPLAAYVASAAALDGDTIVATGALTENAAVLVETWDGIPLLARRTIGNGVVDYLTADPNVAPLRGWGEMSDVWYTLAATRSPVPNWSQTVKRWEAASVAAEILPGLDVLPSVLPICGFLALYIALIGPLNYIVLNRLNRREYAWFTIPVFIVLFSGLAWVVGGELRGNNPSIGRLTMVRSWSDTETAHTTQLIGLLSPQRTQYTLEAPENAFLRTIPNNELVGSNTLLQSTFQTSIEIQQASGFRAFEFPVDASFVAGFASYGTVPRPPISGSVRMRYPEDERNVQIILGSVTNNTEQTLTDGLILARGVAYRLEDIDPGNVQAFPMLNAQQIRLEGREMAAPAPIGYDFARTNLSFGHSTSYQYDNSPDQTVRDIIGNNNYVYNPLFPGNIDANSVEEQETRRRQLFLSALINDPYLSTGRGNQVYYVGWAQGAPNDIELQGREFDAFDTTLYVVALDVEIEQPVNTRVRVASDEFVWALEERTGMGSTAPVNLRVPEGNSITFRYTPLASAQLDSIDTLYVLVQYSSGGARTLPMQLWNWEEQRWDNQTVTGERLEVTSPEPYIGPQNAVRIRMVGSGVYTDIQSVRVEQVGEFAAQG